MFIGIFMTVGYTALDLPSFSDQKYVGDVDTLPLFLGIVLFAYSVITLVLPLKNAMEKPEDFNSPLGILNVSIVITTIIYIIVGVLAYWKYEEKILGSVTLNLDNNLL